MYLGGTPSTSTGTRPPSCLHLENCLCMFTKLLLLLNVEFFCVPTHFSCLLKSHIPFMEIVTKCTFNKRAHNLKHIWHYFYPLFNDISLSLSLSLSHTHTHTHTHSHTRTHTHTHTYFLCLFCSFLLNFEVDKEHGK